MSKYKTLDEIIDAHKIRPEPPVLPRVDGYWALTPQKTFAWVWRGDEQLFKDKYGAAPEKATEYMGQGQEDQS